MGREPTSASCHTCRRRRVRCDKRRPACGQCEKSQNECLGYERILRIQSHGVGFGKQQGCSSFVTIGQSNSYPADAVRGCDDHLSPHDRSQRRKHKTKRHQTISNTANLQVLSSTTAKAHNFFPESPTSQRIRLSLEPFIDNITFSYFFDAYSWINIHSILLQDTPMRQHLTQQKDELGYDSLRALAYGLFARDHQVDGLCRSAERLYGTILEKLQSKLTTSSKSELAALIKPISILGSYAVSLRIVSIPLRHTAIIEIMRTLIISNVQIAVDSDLRFVHHHGLSRILEHCGPEYFQDPTILPIFESCRFTMVSTRDRFNIHTQLFVSASRH